MARDTKQGAGAGPAAQPEGPGAAEPLDNSAALAGAVAHDLGNMLTVMLGNAELLVEGLADHPELAELAELIVGAAQRGTQLTGRLDRFARRIPAAAGPTDLAGPLAEFAANLAPAVPPGIALETTIAPGLWPVALAPAALVVAMEELAANALAALGGRGHLRLVAANRPGPLGERGVRIAVEDEGVGMDEDTLRRVRNARFVSGVAGHKTGVGLPLAMRVAHSAGGTLAIESAPGRGTRVTLDLPAG